MRKEKGEIQPGDEKAITKPAPTKLKKLGGEREFLIKKIFLIFFSLIYFFDNYRIFIPGISASGPEGRSISEPSLLLSLGIGTVVLAGWLKRKFLKS
jgi:hypothetical protein